MPLQISCEEVGAGEIAKVTSPATQKIVHLIRHGQGTHNLFASSRHTEGEPCPCVSDEPDCPLKNAEHTDASLTARGRQQALAAGAKLINTQPVPEVAFVSPLKRTLLTAFIALRRASLHVPILVHEGIRERHGVHLCDMRSPRENIELLFPGVDFSDIPYGPDALFATEREKETEVADRGRAFFEELLKRAESCIAVFSHSSLLYNTINRAFEHTSPNDGRRFETGESRVFILTYKQV